MTSAQAAATGATAGKTGISSQFSESRERHEFEGNVHLGYSIWLSFQGPGALKLQETISCLSRQFSAPEFQPHLTLVGDIDLGLEEVRSLAKRFTGGFIPSEIPIRSVEISDEYFMALHLSVEIPPDLQSMRETVARSANARSYKLDAPHVSLLYGTPGRDALANAQETVRADFAGATLRVSGPSIVQSSKTTPISDWKLVADFD